MTTEPDRPDPDGAMAALSGPPASRVGAFRYEAASDRWWWSEELYRIFGFEPGEIVPTTALIRAHLHPDDLRPSRGGAGLGAGSVASVHRIVDSRGAERAVAVVAVVAVSQQAGVQETVVEGYVADVTGAIRTLASTEATRRIRDPDDQEAFVEQAVGIITATTGRHPDAALALLRAASTRRHVTPGEFARRVIATAAAVGRSPDMPAVDRADPLSTLRAMRQIPRQPPPGPRDPPRRESGAT